MTRRLRWPQAPRLVVQCGCSTRHSPRLHFTTWPSWRMATPVDMVCGRWCGARRKSSWAGRWGRDIRDRRQRRNYRRSFLCWARIILDSRSLAFADDVLATDGQGCRCGAQFTGRVKRSGRNLKFTARVPRTRKRGFYENTRIGLRPFLQYLVFRRDADQLIAGRTCFDPTICW